MLATHLPVIKSLRLEVVKLMKVNSENNYVYLPNPPLNKNKKYGDFNEDYFERLTNFNDYESARC